MGTAVVTWDVLVNYVATAVVDAVEAAVVDSDVEVTVAALVDVAVTAVVVAVSYSFLKAQNKSGFNEADN